MSDEELSVSVASVGGRTKEDELVEEEEEDDGDDNKDEVDDSI